MNTTNTTTDWIFEDAPAEKMILRGTAALTDSEVLAAIIGANSETSLILAKRILKAYDGFTAIKKASAMELQKIQGVTRIVAARIKCAFELGQRQIAEVKYYTNLKTSGDIAELFRLQLADLDVEHFCVAYLNRANNVLSIDKLFTGGVTGVVADPKIILKNAINHCATSIVLAHNHPSGSLKPSRADEDLTQKIKNGAAYLDIKVLDHIIIGHHNEYYSFADEGII
jgi:DNA repair protein RadC